MLPQDSDKELRRSLKDAGLLLKNATATDVLQVAVDFWLVRDIADARQDNGDGLVAYFELMNRGGRNLFEFGVNRIMTPAPLSEEYTTWLPSYRLRLSVSVKPIIEVFQLSPVSSAFMCWDKRAAPAFIEEVRASSQFRLITGLPQSSSGISLDECDTPWGNPVHPTRGLSWAIA